MDRQRVITVLTMVAAAAWVGSLIARAVIPDAYGPASSIDAVMLLICGWWFTNQPKRRQLGS